MKEAAILKAIQKSLLLVVLSLLLTVQALAESMALVIIDMQPVFATRHKVLDKHDNQEKLNSAIDHQIQLIEIAKQNNLPILLIELRGYGQTDFRIADALADYENYRRFVKQTDSFLSNRNQSLKNIQGFLDSLDVERLILTGANGLACVLQSLMDAVDSNYKVTTYSKGIIDCNMSPFFHPFRYNPIALAPNERPYVDKIQQLESLAAIKKLMSTHELPENKSGTLGAFKKSCKTFLSRREIHSFVEYVKGDVEF